jgi:lipopolysaccharide transport system ATP-binding protein
MAYVSLKDVTVEFQATRRGQSRPSLSGIDLELTPGDRLGITGPNGSGKTTLLRVIAGIYPPTRGEVRVEGRIGSLMNISSGMHAKLTGRENILYRSFLLGRDRRTAEKTVEDAIEFGGLLEKIDDRLETYSSGMKMRLAFSIATSAPIDVLVMDEWLSLGDSAFKRRAAERMARIAGDAEILILASHNNATITSRCNRFLNLQRGKGSISEKP